MNLQNKNILLVSPEPWDHIFVSKHHYAVHLGRRGNKVFFLNPPGKLRLLTETGHQNVVSVQYTGFPKGLRYYPHLLQKYFIRQKFRELERLCSIRFDVVWSFDNSVFFDFSVLPGRVLAISHIVDLNQDFQFAAATRTAGICLGVSHSIVEKKKAFNPRSHFVNHGYSVAGSTERVSLPGNYFKYRVGYAGNLDLKYIDWNCLRKIIDAHRDAGFFFAGPYSEGMLHIEWLKKQTNVYLLGRCLPESLPSFYGQMDVLIICYRSDDYAQQLENPHKMMEYLGSGKMIVTTCSTEHVGLKDRKLLLMTDRNEEFPAMFDQALKNLEFWNDDEKRELRINVALDNTYDKQLERIENLINQG